MSRIEQKLQKEYPKENKKEIKRTLYHEIIAKYFNHIAHFLMKTKVNIKHDLFY